MTDDQLLLANAYVDDDLDPPGRARAQADPDVMAEVSRLHAVVAALRDVDPPAPDRRERAIAAALGDAVQVAPPTPLHRRRSWWAGAGVAAALVVVVAGGIVVLRGGRTGGDDDAATFATAAGATELMSASSPLADGGAPAPPQEQERSAADAALPTTTAAGAAVVLSSPAELGAYGAAGDASRAFVEEQPPCVDRIAGSYVGRATYAGVSPAVSVEVFVVGDDVVALDAATCGEIARAERP